MKFAVQEAERGISEPMRRLISKCDLLGKTSEIICIIIKFFRAKLKVLDYQLDQHTKSLPQTQQNETK